MQLIEDTETAITVCLDRTNLEQLLSQLNAFPNTPCWVAARFMNKWVIVTAIDNTGRE